jgi:hypothetical protein
LFRDVRPRVAPVVAMGVFFGVPAEVRRIQNGEAWDMVALLVGPTVLFPFL